jgi:hypothetical protein
MRSGKRQQAPADDQQGAFAWPPASAQTKAAGPPATPAMAATAAPNATRDPWRATPSSSAPSGDGKGNGNGHAKGNGQADVPGADAEPERAGGELFRRR